MLASCSTTLRRAAPPAATVPSDQVTVPPLLVPPSEADTKVVPAGSGNVRFAATAVLPGLAKVNV